MDEQLNQGDLVVTKEGYFALVIFQMEDEVGVFLCNGMATVEDRGDLTVQTILDGPSRANFMEIMPTRGLRSRMIASILEQDHPELMEGRSMSREQDGQLKIISVKPVYTRDALEAQVGLLELRLSEFAKKVRSQATRHRRASTDPDLLIRDLEFIEKWSDELIEEDQQNP